eukprot:4730608-Pyramimonas_sp.AAC.3
MAVMPRDQMSADWSYPFAPWITSGAIQKGVPVKVFRFRPMVWVSCPDTPKSATCRNGRCAS